MKLTPSKRIPGLLAGVVIGLVCLLRWLNLDFCERLERITFDARVGAALRFSPTEATNLGFVFIDEESVRHVWDGSLGYRFGLLWPRQVYARLVQELSQQGARSVALDVIFGELRPDQAPVRMADNSTVESDDFFAETMRLTGNVIIAITPEVTPPALFLTNAAAVADIFADKDSDGILRRACAFRYYRHWHAAFRRLEADPDFGVDLRQARVEARRIVLPRREGGDLKVPLDADGNFDLADFVGDKLPPGMARKAKPFSQERVWHMGLVLAARELGLDLNNAEVDLPHGRITLRGPGGLQRQIPVDADGFFFIDWSLSENDPRLTRQSIHDLLAQYKRRLEGQTNGLVNLWSGKMAIVGSSAVVGNNLTDRGATPVRKDTLLVSKHWNVANSLLQGRFIRRAPLLLELALIALLGVIAGVLTWRLRVLLAAGLVLLLIAGYILFAFGLYVQSRYWIPVVLPVAFACFMTHVTLVTWRVVFEQAERRRVRSLFSTLVSPKIVQELLRAETLPLSARRKVTVFFADVRGFTELTDASQERMAEFVRDHRLTGAAAEACFDEQARETLDTINLYLGLVAGTVIRHDGTHDKFIGDCVMAFWGAPTPNRQQGLDGVRAAIEAQRGIYELNRQRRAENEQREAENRVRASGGLAPRPLLPILFLGTGINTGMATVGLMGAEAKGLVLQRSYTVFGREVNLASRLESASGRGRILISQSTYQELQRDDAALAASCVPLPPITVKGIRTPVQVFEVPWRLAGSPNLEDEFTTRAGPDTTSFLSQTPAGTPAPNSARGATPAA